MPAVTFTTQSQVQALAELEDEICTDGGFLITIKNTGEEGAIRVSFFHPSDPQVDIYDIDRDGGKKEVRDAQEQISSGSEATEGNSPRRSRR